MFLCDFLCGFLLARPLIFKSGPGSYSVVIFQRSIPNNNTLSREGSTTYNSGGSNPATSDQTRPSTAWSFEHHGQRCSYCRTE